MSVNSDFDHHFRIRAFWGTGNNTVSNAKEESQNSCKSIYVKNKQLHAVFRILFYTGYVTSFGRSKPEVGSLGQRKCYIPGMR